jgi:hypothetical protein
MFHASFSFIISSSFLLSSESVWGSWLPVSSVREDDVLVVVLALPSSKLPFLPAHIGGMWRLPRLLRLVSKGAMFT